MVTSGNCSEQAESLADEAVRTDLRCEQTPSAQPIFMGLRIVSVKVLNRYTSGSSGKDKYKNMKMRIGENKDDRENYRTYSRTFRY